MAIPLSHLIHVAGDITGNAINRTAADGLPLPGSMGPTAVDEVSTVDRRPLG
jgi:hypothetical protein